MMLTEGLNRVRDLFNTNTDKGQFGTGSTAEAYTDGSLSSAVAATQKSTTSTTVSQFLVKTMEITSTEGNSNTLQEFVLQKSSTGDTINRVTFTGLAKTNLFNARINVRYFFK